MKLKQVLATAGISALTALAVVWGYSSYLKNSSSYAGQFPNNLPSNYRLASMGENGNPPGAIDFTQPSAAALPAVVHIKTKTNAKQVTNNLPRMRQNPFSDFFGGDDFDNIKRDEGRENDA